MEYISIVEKFVLEEKRSKKVKWKKKVESKDCKMVSDRGAVGLSVPPGSSDVYSCKSSVYPLTPSPVVYMISLAMWASA